MSSVPELVVPTTATQSTASGHDRLLSALTDEETESVDQGDPPFVVYAKAPAASATTQFSAL
jgi:hypothetical protein